MSTHLRQIPLRPLVCGLHFACWDSPKPLLRERRLIDEKIKQLPVKNCGAYLRKMAIDGYILVVDRTDTKAYIAELQAISRNINQIAKRANATGTVYAQDIEDIKGVLAEIWQLQRRTLLNQP